MESPEEVDLELEFASFRRDGDVDALARVFDATAPGLLSVARHLSHGNAEAEDLVQQTFVTAIERAASFDPSRNLLAWLTGILALHARKDGRQSARTVDPQRLPERESEDPHSAVQSAELGAAVDAAVVALPDRYSEVLRLHLREQLAPREIARRLGLDATTARVQLHRGLKLLREALPAGLGAHAAVTLPRHGLPAVRAHVLSHAARVTPAAVITPTVASGVSGLGLLAVAALLLVAGAAAWLAVPDGEAKTAVALAPMPVANSAPAHVLLSQPTGDPSGARTAPAPMQVANANMRTTAVATATVRVSGRLLLPSGAPAVAAEVSLSGWPGNQERVIDFPPPADWQPPDSTRTDAEGRFTLELDPPRAFQFTVDAQLEGHARLSWRWAEILPDARIDVGERSFLPACTVHVRVVGPDSQPLSAIRFQVSGSPARGGWGTDLTDVEPIIVNAVLDEQAGVYVLDGLPPGPTTIQARSDTTEWLQPRTIVTDPSEKQVVELLYDGPDPAKRIVVSWTSRPFFPFRPDLRFVHLRVPGAPDRTAGNEVPASSGGLAGISLSATFDDLAAGTYSVVIDDPRFEPFVQTGVEPGTRVRAKLRGSAALKVTLTDGPRRIEAEPELLTLKYLGVNWSPNEFDLLQPKLLPMEDGYRLGIVPGSCELRARVRGFAEMRISIGQIMPSERREVIVDLSRTLSLRGRALDSTKASPSVGATVLLSRGTTSGHGLEGRSSIHGNGVVTPAADFVQRTDSDGGFAFEGLQPGTWTLRVAWSPWLYTDRTIELTDSHADLLIFPAPDSGWLDVAVLVPDGAHYDEICLGLFLLDRPGGNHLDPHLQPAFSFPLAVGDARPVGSLAPGVYSATAVVQSRGTGYGLGGLEVSIAAGEREQICFDLRESMFGRLAVQVRNGGLALGAASVRVIRVQGEEWGATGQSLDPDGSTFLRAVAPGIVQLEVHARDGSWRWTDPRAIEIAPGQELESEIDVPWVERTIVIRDASGSPIARTQIEFGLEEPRTDLGTGWSSLRTDATGRAQIGLPPGTARLRFENGTTRTLTWSADLQSEIVIPYGV